MTSPIETVRAALTAYNTASALTLPETLLVAAWNALGFEPVTCPSNAPDAKPFDSTALDDLEAFDDKGKHLHPKLYAQVYTTLCGEKPAHEGVELWLASAALAIAAEAYAQCCEDLSDEHIR